MSTFFKRLLDWSRQPTTVAGFSGLVATVAGAVSGGLKWQAIVPLVAGSLAALVLPDNAGARTTVQTVTADLIAAEKAIVMTPRATVGIVSKTGG